MVMGPSHRVRRAGDVRCAQITDGSAAKGRLDVEGDIGVGDGEPAHGALVLPASLEVQCERFDPTEMLDLLRASSELQGIRVETEGVDGGGREQREAVGA